MARPDIYQDLLTIERHIVEVSRIAERLRRYIERAEATGGDAARAHGDLASVQAARTALLLQREQLAGSIHEMTRALLDIRRTAGKPQKPAPVGISLTPREQ